ncbi:MAG: 5'-nucleotidase [Oleiphilus sp.]|nr:MAG: 5'-nucleotidase [Oleiphilus sp.]
MPMSLSDTLVVGISATALFDLGEADKVFREQWARDPDNAIEIYREYMQKRESEPLNPGTGFHLVKALLSLNKFQVDGEPPLVEVVVMSRNSPETGIRVFHNIRTLGLNITRSAFTGGESVVDYLDAYDVDLFLTTNVSDAQRVIDGETCAVALVQEPPKDMAELPEDQVRIAFDGDAVLFSEQSEIVYKSEGLDAFHEQEDREQKNPLEDGPYAVLLKKLSRLQERLPHKVEYSPVRIAIVTARGGPAEMRVLNTLRHWGVYVDEVFFLGGLEKSAILKAFKAHIFFDDQDTHLSVASEFVPSGKVPYKSTSALYSLENGK